MHGTKADSPGSWERTAKRRLNSPIFWRGQTSYTHLLGQSPLPCAKAPLAASSGLRRVCRDELYAELSQGTAHLCECLSIDRLSRLWRQPEMAGTIRVQRTKHAFFLDDLTNTSHYRPGRLFIHQLGVIDLRGGVVEEHDQVLPPLVAEPLVL